MISWIKKIFKKEKEEEPHNPQSAYISSSSYYTQHFQSAFNEQLLQDEELKKQATAEISKLHTVTQNILKDLDTSDFYNSYYSFYPKEVYVLKIGRIIDEHVKKADFQKKLKDIIDDKND